MYRRIRMNLLNPTSDQQIRAPPATALYNNQTPFLPFRSLSLSSPMIGRVNNIKPGCSACGKRVM